MFLFEFESFRISATDAKYSFSLFAISRESVICSSLITSSSGKLLASELEPLLTLRRLLVFLFEFESFRISATDAKYSFSLFAISRESVICSSLITSSSGKLLASELEPLLTLRRCFHMDLVSLELFIQIEK